MTGQEGETARKPLQGRAEKLLYLSNFHFRFLPLFGQGPHSFILHEAPQALYLTLHRPGAVGRVLDEQAPESWASGGQWGPVGACSVRSCPFPAGGADQHSGSAPLEQQGCSQVPQGRPSTHQAHNKIENGLLSSELQTCFFKSGQVLTGN